MRAALWGLFMLVSACATTQVQGSWVSPAPPASLGRTLVVGLSEEVTWARSFESRMAAHLEAAGGEAVALGTLHPGGLQGESAEESHAEIQALVEAQGFDSVLVGHLSGVFLDVEALPIMPYDALGPWWGTVWDSWWYGGSTYGALGPPYTVQQQWRVETRLFDAREPEGKLIWSMVATTVEEPLQALSDIARDTVKRLGKLRLLP